MPAQTHTTSQLIFDSGAIQDAKYKVNMGNNWATVQCASRYGMPCARQGSSFMWQCVRHVVGVFCFVSDVEYDSLVLVK